MEMSAEDKNIHRILNQYLDPLKERIDKIEEKTTDVGKSGSETDYVPTWFEKLVLRGILIIISVLIYGKGHSEIMEQINLYNKDVNDFDKGT